MTSKPTTSHVEARRCVEVADVQMDVADRRVRIDRLLRLLVRDGLEEGAQVERVGPAAHHGEVWPLLLRPVGGQLDAVSVGIREVDRLRDPVVRGALDRRPRARPGGPPRGQAPRREGWSRAKW